MMMSRVERHRKSESFQTRLNPLQTAVSGMSNHNNGRSQTGELLLNPNGREIYL